MSRVGFVFFALLVAAGASCKASSDQGNAKISEDPDTAKAEPEPPLPRDSFAPILVQVLLEIADPDVPRDMPVERMQAAARSRLLEPGAYTDSTKGSQAPRCEVHMLLSYDLIKSDSDKTTMFLSLEAKVVFIDRTTAPAANANLLVERPLRATEMAAADVLLAQLGEKAVLEAADLLAAMERLRRSPDTELLQAIEEQRQADLRSWALRLAGERKLVAAVPSVIAALTAEEEPVVREAIAALVAIGDPRAVGALTKRVDFQDFAQVRMTIEAVSVIGGDDAGSFLEFVATGHPDADIQLQAREALARLK